MKENRDIEAMETFLREQNMNIPNKLDKLGEQYTMAIFKNLKIRKNPKTHETTPDFTFYVNERDPKANTINKKSFQMETTVLGDIYSHIFDIYSSKEHRDEIERFLKQYEVILDPLNIHKEDEKTFRSVFIERLDELKEKKKVTIQGKLKKYIITCKKLEHPQRFPIFLGKIKKAESNLKNIISKKSDQLKKTDVMFFIVLNKYIYNLELIQTIYREHGIGSLKDNKMSSTIVQYQFDNTIWEISDYNLKYVIFCYPATKKIYLCPSLKFDSNSPIIFCSLMDCFNKFNFEVEIAKHGTEWINELNEEYIKEYEKIKESIIKSSFDPVAKKTCSWNKEKAFRLTDYHAQIWIEILSSIMDVYSKSYYSQSLLFLFFNSLFKEIYWIQLLFLWGNYRVINSNLRYIIEEMSLGYYIDHKFHTLDLDAKIKKAEKIDGKGIYGWNLLQSVLADMGIKEESRLKTIKDIFWKSFHSYVHPKPTRLLEVSEIDPKSTVIDSFNEYLAEECLSHIDTSFDFIYFLIILNFPNIIEELKKIERFNSEGFKKVLPLTSSLLFSIT